MLRSFLAFAAATALAVTGLAVSPPASASAADDVLLPNGETLSAEQVDAARTVFDGINAYRAGLDVEPRLEPLRFAPDLFDLAQRWSDDMVAADSLTHRPKHWTLYPPGSSGGEIIAARSDDNVAGLVQQWINSPSHEALLRSGTATVMGAGVTLDTARTARWYTYGTVDFGAYEEGVIPIYDSIDDWIADGAPLSRDDVVGGLHGVSAAVTASGAGTLTLEGWAIDFTDRDRASTVVVTLDGVRSVRPTAGSSVWNWGPDRLRAGHDFRATFGAEPGSEHRVCAVATNSFGVGQDRSLGCLNVRVPIPAERLAGDNRYDTAVEVSQQYNAPGDVHTVYLATGQKYPDALSLAPAAARDGHALLLTPTSRLLPEVAAELKRLDPEHIIVVGTDASVSDEVALQAAAAVPGVEYERIGGADRYATSVQIAQHAFPNATLAYVASGALFPDALSAAPVAAATDAPVVLTAPSHLPDSVREYFASSDISRVVVAGGAPSVSAAVVDDLDAIVGGEVERIAGADRFETNRALAATASSSPHGEVLLASGLNFPDALAGAAVGTDAGPLLLTRGTCVPAETLAAIYDDYSPETVVLLGGEPTLGPEVAALTACG